MDKVRNEIDRLMRQHGSQLLQKASDKLRGRLKEWYEDEG